MVGLVLVVGSIFYRNWRYEQELDSLLWKIEYKELQVEEMITMTDRICLARPITSQCVCVCVCVCVCIKCEVYVILLINTFKNYDPPPLINAKYIDPPQTISKNHCIHVLSCITCLV